MSSSPPRGFTAFGLSSGGMTPQLREVEAGSVLDEMVTDLKYMLMLAQRIQTTEQVQQGTDEFVERETAKDLFEQGVMLFDRWFDGMRTW